MDFEIFKTILISKQIIFHLLLIIQLKFVLKIILTFGCYTPVSLFPFSFRFWKKGTEKQGGQNMENAFVCWYCSTEDKIPTCNSLKKREK